MVDMPAPSRPRPWRGLVWGPLLAVSLATAGAFGAGRTKEGIRTQVPETELARGKLAYERGDYAGAISALRPLLYPATLLSVEQDVLLAHKLLALSYFFEKDSQGAEQEFNVLLSLRPDFALDPLVEPEKAVAFVDSLRRRNEDRLTELRKRQAEEEARRKTEAEAERLRLAEELRKTAPRVYVERVVEKRLSVVTFLPFGIPQFVDRRTRAGALFFSGEVLLGAASVATWLTVRLRYPNNTFPASEYVRAQGLTATYLTTGVAFWALCAGGLLDALLHARTKVTYRELPSRPKELSKDGAAPKQLTLLPIVGVGVGVGAGDSAGTVTGLSILGTF